MMFLCHWLQVVITRFDLSLLDYLYSAWILNSYLTLVIKHWKWLFCIVFKLLSVVHTEFIFQYNYMHIRDFSSASFVSEEVPVIKVRCSEHLCTMKRMKHWNFRNVRNSCFHAFHTTKSKKTNHLIPKLTFPSILLKVHIPLVHVLIVYIRRLSSDWITKFKIDSNIVLLAWTFLTVLISFISQERQRQNRIYLIYCDYGVRLMHNRRKYQK